MTPDEAVEQTRKRVRTKFDPQGYETVIERKALEDWIAAVRKQGFFALHALATSADPMRADLAGISIAIAPGRACYIPVGHRKGDGLNFGETVRQLAETEAVAELRPLLEGPGILKIGQNLKYRLPALRPARGRDGALRRLHAHVVRL